MEFNITEHFQALEQTLSVASEPYAPGTAYFTTGHMGAPIRTSSRRGHKSYCPQQRLDALAQREMSLMLIEQDQLIDDHGARREQLRPLQAFDGHFHPPLKDAL